MEPFEMVWYVPAAHPYFEEVRVGVEACEKELGAKVEYQVGPDWQQSSQNQNMEALAAKGSKYFAVYPADASGANWLYEAVDCQRCQDHQLRHLHPPADHRFLCRGD